MAKCKNMEDMMGKNGLFKRMLKEMTEQMLEGELTGHLGYEKHAAKGRKSGNSRNGRTGKKVRTELGEISLRLRRFWSENGFFAEHNGVCAARCGFWCSAIPMLYNDSCAGCSLSEITYLRICGLRFL